MTDGTAQSHLELHQRIAQNCAQLGFVEPSYDGASLSTLLSAAVGALRCGGVDLPLDDAGASTMRSGAGPGQREPLAAEVTLAAQSAWNLPAAHSVCIVLVDGLGALNLEEYQDYAPHLTQLLTTRDAHDGRAEARSGFPSTTAASMSQLGTGLWPGATGMISYSALSPNTGRIGNFVSWRDMDDPKTVQRTPVLFEQLAALGMRVTSIGQARFQNSGMTQAVLRGAQYQIANDLISSMNIAGDLLRQPGLTYLYWGDLDKAGHVYGVGSPAWLRELQRVDDAIAWLIDSKPGGSAVVITADHGMVNVDFSARIDLAQEYPLARGLRALAGEPRCPHAYFNSPKYAADAYLRWREELDGFAIVLTRDELIDSGLLGPVSSHVAPWIGHLVAIMGGQRTLIDSASASPKALALKGVHGSLSPAEVLIPRIVI